MPRLIDSVLTSSQLFSAMPIPVIINPTANSTRANLQLDRIRQLSPAPELHITTSAGDARQMAQSLAAQGHPLIIAAGGDGTVNEIVNGISQHNAGLSDPAQHVTLGILPVGTMNVLAYELTLPSRNLEATWDIIQHGKPHEIDLWLANDLYFCQLAGIGFDAEVVQQTTWEDKRRFGPMSYVMTAVKVLGQVAPKIAVEIPGRPTLYGSIVLVGNGKHYGGPVPVFKDASNTDGLLDLIIFHGRGPIEVFQFLSALTVSGYAACDDLDYIQASEFTVTSEARVPFELDGELGETTPICFKKAPFNLRVIGGYS
jgi:diacylglycerol kinase (ATP)